MRGAKLAIWRAARGCGLFSLVRRSAWRRERLLILCYHGLALEREHEWDPALFLSPDRFRRRMEAIRRSGMPVLPLGEALDRLKAEDLGQPTIALTFDDGFCDFHRFATPILTEFDFPATIYLTTYYVDYLRPIFNLIVPYMLWLRRDSGATLGKGLGLPEPVPSSAWRRAAAEIIDSALERGLSAEEKDELAAKTAEAAGLDYVAVRESRVLSLMTPSEVDSVAANPLIDVELHTHRHRTPDDEQLFRREIQDNRSRITELTGRRASHFCYPSGVYQPAFLPWLQAEGVVSATTCDPGLASPNTDPLLLPRKIDTAVVTDVEFEAWLSALNRSSVRSPRGRTVDTRIGAPNVHGLWISPAE